MPNSLLITIFIISILGSAFAFAFIFSKFNENISVIKSLVFGVVGYFFIYILTSAALFTFDYFSISKAVVFSLATVLVILSISVIASKKLKKIRFEKKELITVLVIVLFSFLITGSKFGFFGMGQDQGVYQTKAIELIYENNSNVLNFDYALKALNEPSDYKYFRDKVKLLQGYYLVGQTEPFYADDNAGGETGLEGIYHGLPTWPAILALFGRMFGVSHMQDCQTVFFICFLMLTFYILENFRIKILYEAIALSILGTTPLMVWVSKSALTEMFLAVIMAFFVYLLCNEKRDAALFLWVPVAVFSFYHVSAYTLMPLFVICGLLNELRDKRKRAVFATLLMLPVYLAGFLFSIRMASLYTIHNYLQPLRRLSKNVLDKLSGDNELTLAVIIAVSACFLSVLIISLLFKISAIKKLIEKAKSNRGLIIKIVSLIVTVLAIFICGKILNGNFSDPRTNLTAVSLATGIISVPLIFAGLVFIRRDRIIGTPMIYIYVTFMYMMIWTVFLRPKISHFYYYGRYDVPFLMIFVVFLFVLYRDFEKTEWIPAVCVSSVILYLNYDVVMIKTPDDTKLPWDVVEAELKQERLPNSAVILEADTETLLEWMLILKASGEEVYPYDGDLNSQSDILSQYYDNVYFFYEDNGDFDITAITEKDYKPLYYYSFVHSEDMVNGTKTWIGYPEYFYNETYYTYIYLYSVDDI